MSDRDSSGDRPAIEPGGMECVTCGMIFIGEEWHLYCAKCLPTDLTPDEDRALT